jgi:hypothetical protein
MNTFPAGMPNTRTVNGTARVQVQRGLGRRVEPAHDLEAGSQMAMTMRRMKKALATGTTEADRARMIWRRTGDRPERSKRGQGLEARK